MVTTTCLHPALQKDELEPAPERKDVFGVTNTHLVFLNTHRVGSEKVRRLGLPEIVIELN